MSILSTSVRIAVMSLLVGGVAANWFTDTLSDIYYGKRASENDVRSFLGSASSHGMPDCANPLSATCDALYTTLHEYGNHLRAPCSEVIAELAKMQARVIPALESSGRATQAATDALNTGYFGVFTGIADKPAVTWVCIVALLTFVAQSVKTTYKTGALPNLLFGVIVVGIIGAVGIVITMYCSLFGLVITTYAFSVADLYSGVLQRYADRMRVFRHEETLSEHKAQLCQLEQRVQRREGQVEGEGEVAHQVQWPGSSVSPTDIVAPLSRPSAPMPPPSAPQVYLGGGPIQQPSSESALARTMKEVQAANALRRSSRVKSVKPA